MDKYDTELLRAINLPSDITATWAQVFLKSGQTLFIKANSYLVFEDVQQDSQKGTKDEPAMPEIKINQVQFYDEDDDPIDDDMVLPWENVAAIRFFKPLADGADRIKL
jgi:hypothetical protein